MPALATLIPYLVKYVLPVVVLLGIVGYFYVKYTVNKRKLLEDRMKQQKDQADNQISQLQSVQKVDEDMAQATTNRPTASTVEKRMSDGTF